MPDVGTSQMRLSRPHMLTIRKLPEPHTGQVGNVVYPIHD